MTTFNKFATATFTYLLIFCLCLIVGDEVCNPDDGEVCSSSLFVPRNCDVPDTVCYDQAKHSSIYGAGGTAQAYKADAPIKNTVCASETSKRSRHRVSSWPYSRSSSKKNSSPKLIVKVNLMGCDLSESGEKKKKSKKKTKTCCCGPLLNQDSQNSSISLEVWQARPDGTYSSLRNGHEDGECRAKVPLISADDKDGATAEFTTYAPGSTGSMGGLGPSKWEFMPYGPPVIHMFVSAPGFEPLLVDLPLLFHRKTLNERSFGWSDWRGSAWVKSQTRKKSYEITSWKESTKKNSITVNVDLYLHAKKEDDGNEALSSIFCPSRIYGFPKSFFLEPISLCAPVLMDYFDL